MRLLAAALAACVMPGPYGRPGLEPDLLAPEIVAYTLTCDVDAASWTLTAEASSWSGRATSWWTVDGAYVEEHVVDTVGYEPDGTGESLKAVIAIVADWRLQSARNTAFTCADDPDVVFQLADTSGVLVDCRVSGPDPSIWGAVPGVEPCPLVTP